jgi:paraquat-inducible protein A
MALPLLLLTALGLLAVGVTLPIVTVETLVLFSRPYSILDVTLTLFQGGEWLIATIVGTFSLVLPAGKLLLMIALWARLRLGRAVPHRLLQGFEAVARWSMLDVLAAALIVFALKSRALSDARFEPGIYFFLGSIATTALCSFLLKRRAAAAA